MPVVNRCEVTKNQCGTDTWAEGYACACAPCQHYLNVKASKGVTVYPSSFVRFPRVSEVAEMQRKLQLAIKTLNWYADPANWDDEGHCGYATCQEGHEDPEECDAECYGWEDDFGSEARKALKEMA